MMGFPFFIAQRYSGGQRQYFSPEWMLRYRVRPDQVCGVPALRFSPPQVYRMLGQIPPTRPLY